MRVALPVSWFYTTNFFPADREENWIRPKVAAGRQTIAFSQLYFYPFLVTTITGL
jgi:hypothetical protein